MSLRYNTTLYYLLGNILLFNKSNLILIYPALFLQVHGIVDASLIDVLHKEKKIGKTGLLLRALLLSA